uniref:Uncharacterized protein n=1 Tax=Siphoviridae sp. ctdYc1 TaxID=2826399 RepID=A0A8S5N047_9CAUD|nr:MAG TPA: hypothetical protein [Siphoviridae sp. ctdYc1]
MDHNTSCLYDFLYTPLSSRSTIPCCSHRLSMVNTLPFVTSKPLGENGAFPPTRDGCIHSLSMRERG